jgi:CubicO group peptidase (beta-lactamase class C family)
LRVAYAPIPVSGAGVPSLIAFDDAVIEYMQARGIPSGEIEVIHAGQTVLSRAYGWKDKTKTTPFAAGSPMRIASLTKPLTEAAIRQLVADGKFSYSTPAFSLLGLTQLPSNATVDSRLASITIQQLLDHYAGFGPSGSVPDSRVISLALGLSRPPTPAEVVQYTMGRPLMYAPGSTYAYSNVGYLILGLIVEKMSAKDYGSYVRQNLFLPTFTPDLQLARTLPADRDAREPWYSDPSNACSVFVMTGCTQLPTPDGGAFYFEDFVSYGGIVTTPATYLEFMKRYWGDGKPRVAGQSQSWTWLGSINGTSTFARWRSDGTMFVAFFNQRADASGLAYDTLWQTLDTVTGGITKWP